MSVTFKLFSLNTRGIRCFENRKAMFAWLMKQHVDICFLQETYSTKEIENSWKMQWNGDMFFSHGSEHSRGVLIMVKNSLEFELKLRASGQSGAVHSFGSDGARPEICFYIFMLQTNRVNKFYSFTKSKMNNGY